MNNFWLIFSFFGAAISSSSHASPGEQPGSYAYITNQLDDSVSVIAIPTGELISTIATAPNPAPIAICGNTAVVTSADAHQITLIDLKTHETQQLTFAKGPFGVDCDERTAYIGDWYTNQIHLLNLSDLSLLQPSINVGRAPSGVLINPGLQHLYVANRDDDTLSVVDLNTRKVIATLSTGDAPYGLTLNAANNQLYIINVRSNDVTVVDTLELTVITRWPLGEWPYCGAVNQDGSLLYATNQEDATLSVLDTRTGKSLHTLPISEVPEGVDITADQRYIVTVGWESGMIDIIDATTLKLVGQHKAGKGSRSFGRFITSIQPGAERK